MSTEYKKFIYHPKYEPTFKNEFLDIIDSIETQVRASKIDTSNVEETNGLCCLFLYSILSMIRSVYLLLEERRKVEVDILLRSLIEYYLDLTYLSIKDDKALNRRFTNYYKLILFWHLKRMTVKNRMQNEHRITSDYRKYVESEFSDITQHMNGSDEDSWKQINEKIAKTYKKSWSGLNSHQRLEAVQNLIQDDPIQDAIVKRFNHYSNKTHPTPYGIPIFNPRNGSFQIETIVSNSVLKENELFLFWVAESAIKSFSKTLPSDEGKRLLKRFWDLTNLSTKLKMSLKEQGNYVE